MEPLGKQSVDVLVRGLPISLVQGRIVPGAHPRQQLNTKEGGQAKYRLGLPRLIDMQGVGLQGWAVLEQAVKWLNRAIDVSLM
jgi:hypothetical protein